MKTLLQDQEIDVHAVLCEAFFEELVDKGVRSRARDRESEVQRRNRLPNLGASSRRN